MTLTFEELKERLSRWDEVDLIERLNITSMDIVEMFADKIEENFDSLSQDEEDVDWEETSD
mgnify:CR=1 FL=1